MRNKREHNPRWQQYADRRRDDFSGYLAFNVEESWFIGATSQHHAVAIASKNNKNYINHPGLKYGNAWHPVHYQPGQHWVMLDFLPREERGLK